MIIFGSLSLVLILIVNILKVMNIIIFIIVIILLPRIIFIPYVIVRASRSVRLKTAQA
jgi:hypothetical protein